MLIERIQVGSNFTNCYIAGEEGGKGVIIDPGAEPAVIKDKVEEIGITIEMIINTHGHFDHIGGNEFLSNHFEVPVVIHKLGADFLTDPRKNLSHYTGQEKGTISPDADRLLEDEEQIMMGSFSFDIYHTPGHSPGSIILYNHRQKTLFSGDTIFAMGIGRTDLPGSSEKQLHESIKNRILNLPEDTRVYPGHGESTFLGDFKNNIWLRVGS